ncbi:type II secretion system secretin GspD [Verrucomicrobiota bacterium]
MKKRQYIRSRGRARFLVVAFLTFAVTRGSVFPQAGVLRPPGSARRPTPATPSLIPPARAAATRPPARARPPVPTRTMTPPTAGPATAAKTAVEGLSFKDAPMDMLWTMYSELTGRTLLLAPKLPRDNVTLKNQSDLDVEETLLAIEAVLSMHGIALLKEGEKFLRVVPISKAREEPMKIREVVAGEEEVELKDSPELISQMVALKHIDTAEAEKALTPFRHATFGKVVRFERTNHILVTDTTANVNRIAQILKHIDQPTVAREEPHIIQIVYAKASDIKRKLEEIIAESQKQQQEKKKKTAPRVSRSGAPRVVKRAVPGVIRPPVAKATASALPEPVDIAEMIEQAERGIIHGRVQIIADERTNLLIIITRPENMRFFDKIIKVLDVDAGPDVIVKVFRLEFAEAGNIASMLNSLIGASTAGKDAPPPGSTPADGGEPDKRSAALREYINRQTEIAAKQAAAAKSKVGELAAANIKILSDERTNSLIIMASKADLLTLQEIITDMDMMLSQVLIESIIIEVQLGDELQTGIDWLNRSLIHYRQGSTGRAANMANTGSFGGGTLTPRSALTSATTSPGGLTQYFTFFGLDLDVVIQMVSKDDRTRVVSAPIILTTDNTEATISSTERIYVFQGKKRDQYGGEFDDYKTEDVGLHLTVKPHINEKKMVMMEIKQTMSEPGSVGEPQSGASVSSERQLQASIAVKDRQTIVLGGQVRNQATRSRTKVPLLGDIPLLGRLFSFNSASSTKREMVVFITPYVLNTAEEIEEESARRKLALSTQGLWCDDWSASTLAESTPRGRDTRQQARETGRARAAVDNGSPAAARGARQPGSALDPALLDFITRQEERWQEALEEADRRVDEETGARISGQNN